MIPMNTILRTAGDGLWSNQRRAVIVTGIDLGHVANDGVGPASFGELRVYFNTDTWEVSRHGLIYTDSEFLAELRVELALRGMASRGVDYSEQGMQGRDYVSLDVDGAFIHSFRTVSAAMTR